VSETAFGVRYDYETFLRRVLSVREPEMRRSQIHRQLVTLEPSATAEHLERCIVEAIQGEEGPREVLHSFLQFYDHTEPQRLGVLDSVDLEARRAGHSLLSWLLLDPPPARSVEGNRLAQSRGRALTLGERRSLASGWDPRMIERLTLDNEPMVIDRLCMNTRTGEHHILAILTRRPTLPEIIRTVARHPRWVARPIVREAIVQNPFGPTGLALRTLPLVPWGTVEKMQHAGDLHPLVPAFARALVRARTHGMGAVAPPETFAPLRSSVDQGL
jgi:hypothetical protein